MTSNLPDLHLAVVDARHPLFFPSPGGGTLHMVSQRSNVELRPIRRVASSEAVDHLGSRHSPPLWTTDGEDEEDSLLLPPPAELRRRNNSQSAGGAAAVSIINEGTSRRLLLSLTALSLMLVVTLFWGDILPSKWAVPGFDLEQLQQLALTGESEVQAEHCERRALVCPRGGGSEVSDLPFKCSEGEVAWDSPGGRHAFTVEICRGPERLYLRVEHTEGFADEDPLDHLCSTGPDYINAQIFGPETRLAILQRVNSSNMYEAEFLCAMPGDYTFDLVVVRTPRSKDGMVGKIHMWYTRNLVLLKDEAWRPTRASEQELLKDSLENRMSTNGRWIRKHSDLLGVPPELLISPAGFAPTKFLANGYRCQHLGDYTWSPNLSTEPLLSWDRDKVVACLQSAKALEKPFYPFPALLAIGDSQTRSVVNALLEMVWPDRPDMRITKDDKNEDVSKCVGGLEDGFSICMIWAPHGFHRPGVEENLHQFDYVLMNVGQHPIANRLTDPTLSYVAFWEKVGALGIVQEMVDGVMNLGAAARVAWLQTFIAPNTGGIDERNTPGIMDVNRVNSALFERSGLQEIKTEGLLLPFQDCHLDGSHFGYGLPAVMVREKVLPWLCPASAAE